MPQRRMTARARYFVIQPLIAWTTSASPAPSSTASKRNTAFSAHSSRAVSKKETKAFTSWIPSYEEPDQAPLRDMVPERRRRAYEVRPVIEILADAGSVTFLRERFAPEMVTALARMEGRPVGIVANNTMHMAGAITSEGADKAARFMQLCDAFGLAVISLVDTPGMMVGPEAEATGLVRHCCPRIPRTQRAPDADHWGLDERHPSRCRRQDHQVI